MLRYEAVSPGTLNVLRDVMKLPEMSGFRLVGGTSLALQIGHRTSIDLDFFTDRSFDVVTTRMILENKLNPFALKSMSKTGFACYIRDVKCDFFNWSVPFIAGDIIEDGIRLCSLKDIAAFKLDAIITRKEMKDFWDIDALLSLFNFNELLQFYRQKFLYNDIKVVMDAIAEIDIADTSGIPDALIQRSWPEIKEHIKKEWKQFQFDKLQQKEMERNERIKKAEELLKQKQEKGSC